jgi:hypothetical protein
VKSVLVCSLYIYIYIYEIHDLETRTSMAKTWTSLQRVS